MSKLTDFKEKVFVSNSSYTMKEQLGYCGGIFGNCMGQDCIGTFADKFFRQFMYIEAGQMTLYGNIALALGFIVAAISGYILDTPSKAGRMPAARRITGLMPLPFAVSSMLLFVVPSSIPFFSSLLGHFVPASVAPAAVPAFKNFIWMTVFHLIFNTADQFYDASLNTVSLRITTNTKDRKNFYTVGTLASALGSMLPGWLIPMFVGSTKEAKKQKAYYFNIALVFCVMGVSLMLAPFFTLNDEKLRVKERPEKTKLSWDRETLLSILHNKPFIITEVATFFEQIRQISYTLFPYVYEDVLQDLRLKTFMDIVSGALSYVGLLLVPFLGSHFAPRTILSGGFAYTGLFYGAMGLPAIRFSSAKMNKMRILIGILIGFAGMPNNAISASKKMMVGDSTDYMEWYAEKRFGRPIHAEGFITATQSLLGNVFNVIRTNLYNIVFGKLGYLPNYIDETTGEEVKAVQSEKTLKGIYLMFILCGVLGNLFASVSYLFDNYTGKRKEDINAELQAMREKRQETAAAAAEAAQ
ncbi:MAG: MFS transporter [Clostridia bacterium]|nr:MFS transporter [Clostridia bacterium]